VRRTPSVLALLAALPVLVVLSVSPAYAAGCPSLTDAAGDGRWNGVLSSPAWDIRSADVATGATTLVGVLRVAGFPADGLQPALFPATSYRLGWTIGTARHVVDYRVSANPASGSVIATYGWTDGAASGSAPVTAVLDRTAGTITWTVARTDVPGLTGATLSDLGAVSNWWSGTADGAASSGAFFTDGNAGCVPAA
jgi:hypothetical protein